MNAIIGQIRQEIPQIFFAKYSIEKSLIYLDNGATTPKPKCVIDSEVDFYTNYNANVHRSGSWLSGKATDLYEGSRVKVQKFINAPNSNEIIFTKGCTESINLVAQSLNIFQVGDVVLISQMEHHSNILAWQKIAKQKSLIIKYIPILVDGKLDMIALENILASGVKLVAVCHVSNVLGIVNPVQKIVNLAHKFGSLVLVDGTQAVSHFKVDVQSLECDFYCFSAHKMYGPTGVGVLYLKEQNYQYLDLYQVGGGMLKSVSEFDFVPEKYPTCFEAGTPNIAGVVGFGVAIQWLDGWFSNVDVIKNQNKITKLLHTFSDQNFVGLKSFYFEGINSFDLAQYLDLKGICVRSGHHCALPLLQTLGFDDGMLRISCGIYNTVEEVSFALEIIQQGIKRLG